MQSYTEVIEALRAAYARSAVERDVLEKSDWKLAERSSFLQRLIGERRMSLLEVGAGTGQDSLFFQQHGLRVVATDLVPEMVERCRAKGLDAHTMDFLHLDFAPRSFAAVYSLNCLLHVPNVDLPAVLAALHRVLEPEGLFFLGVYGGESFEGIWTGDWHDPQRFFCFRSDAEIVASVGDWFDILEFHVIPAQPNPFQSLTLRARRLGQEAT